MQIFETPTRRLATIEIVADLMPIEGADAIELAKIRGWNVVVKKGEFCAGDPCVYVEVDSMLDITDPRFEFLARRATRTDTVSGRKGHVLKTIKLRGEYSQGLALPLELFPELGDADSDREAEDVTQALGVRLWEAPAPADLACDPRGPLPSWIPKTDEERVQNVPEILENKTFDWVATEKIDGSCVTYWVDGDQYGSCSRNFDLVETPTNSIWKLAEDSKIFDKLRSSGLGDRAAVQGEIYGEGIQANPLKIRGQRFAAFNVLGPNGLVATKDWPDFVRETAVPCHELPFPASVDAALAQVDRLPSAINSACHAEGIVWRSSTTNWIPTDDGRKRASFKVISNRYLLKHDR